MLFLTQALTHFPAAECVGVTFFSHNDVSNSVRGSTDFGDIKCWYNFMGFFSVTLNQ